MKTLKEFLDENPIIDKAQLAKLMWPNNKTPRVKLYNKLSESQGKTGKQRITEKDVEEAKKVLNDLVEQISKL